MKPNLLALLPCFVFFILFAVLNIMYGSDCVGRENFPIFAAFVALIVSMFTFQKNITFNERIEVFIKGSSQSMLVHTCYIFFLTTIFTAILTETSCITSITNLILHVISIHFILPTIFLATALFSYAVSMSIGTIALFMPIIIKIAGCTGLNLPLIAATVVCGSIFGENLSILSNSITTIKNNNIDNVKNIFFNIKIIFPAFITTMIILIYHNSFMAIPTYLNLLPEITPPDIIKTLPYLLIFYLALTGLDFIIIMMLGIMLTLLIGLHFNNITPLTSINIIFDGFYHSKTMVNVFILILLLSGLSTIIIHNGGVEYLIERLKYKISLKSYNKITLFCLATLVNGLIAIIISGQFVKKTYLTHDLIPEEASCFINIKPCILQGMLPYIPQLILAASMANISFISLLPYLYYQFILGLCLIITILWQTSNNNHPCKFKHINGTK